MSSGIALRPCPLEGSAPKPPPGAAPPGPGWRWPSAALVDSGQSSSSGWAALTRRPYARPPFGRGTGDGRRVGSKARCSGELGRVNPGVRGAPTRVRIMHMLCSDGLRGVLRPLSRFERPDPHLEMLLALRKALRPSHGLVRPLSKALGVLPTRLPSPVPRPKGGRA